MGAKVTGGLEVTGVTTCGGNIDANGNLDVAGTSVFNDDVTLTGAAANVVWNKSDDELEFADDAKATFGTVPDLEIYHAAGGDSIIHHTAASGSGLRLRSRAFTFKNQANNATIATLNEGDACTRIFRNSYSDTNSSNSIRR